VHLGYHRDRSVEADTTVAAQAKEDLASFSLDFFGPRVTEVRLETKRVRYRRKPGKLVVFPKAPIQRGKSS